MPEAMERHGAVREKPYVLEKEVDHWLGMIVQPFYARKVAWEEYTDEWVAPALEEAREVIRPWVEESAWEECSQGKLASALKKARDNVPWPIEDPGRSLLEWNSWKKPTARFPGLIPDKMYRELPWLSELQQHHEESGIPGRLWLLGVPEQHQEFNLSLWLLELCEAHGVEHLHRIVVQQALALDKESKEGITAWLQLVVPDLQEAYGEDWKAGVARRAQIFLAQQEEERVEIHKFYEFSTPWMDLARARAARKNH